MLGLILRILALIAFLVAAASLRTGRVNCIGNVRWATHSQQLANRRSWRWRSTPA